MERIRVQNEDLELQRILEKNHNLLPGDQINPEDPCRWLLIKREMPVPDPTSGKSRWSVDFLFVDQKAMPTLVECKRFASTEARRQVVGQMIEYAANGHRYWDKDLLRDYAEKSLKQGRTLDAELTELQGPEGGSPDEFFDKVQQNLAEGQLRIVFFLDKAPEELQAIVEFLNKQMERSEVLLVEARQYHSNGKRIVVPTLFGYSEQARQVKKMATVTLSTSRRHWDEKDYFEDAQTRLGDGAGSLRELYDQLSGAQGFEIGWGTGQVGSFNPKAPAICPRSLISVFSNGLLWLNLVWLPDLCREKLKALATDELGLVIRPELGQPSFSLTEWGNKVDLLVKGLVRVVEELRTSEDSPSPAEQ
jgi:hypothetical protein